MRALKQSNLTPDCQTIARVCLQRRKYLQYFTHSEIKFELKPLNYSSPFYLFCGFQISIKYMLVEAFAQ